VADLRLGGAEARLKRGLCWRHHIKPTVTRPFYWDFVGNAYGVKPGPLFYIRSRWISRSFIVWQWKKLSFGINFCFYLTELFKNFLKQILTHRFSRYWSWFEAFLYLHIADMLLGSLWKQSTYTLQWRLGTIWKQSTWLRSASEYMMWVYNNLFTKNEGNVGARHFEGAQGKCLSCASPLKLTTGPNCAYCFTTMFASQFEKGRVFEESACRAAPS